MVSFNVIQERWAKKSELERILLVSVVVLILLVFSLSIAVGLIRRNSSKGEGLHICRTKSCLQLSSQLLDSMDFSKDPCEDFYSYTCGNWIQKQKIPDELFRYGTSEKLRDDVLIKLNGLLSQDGTLGINSTAVKNTLKYYSSCLNTSAIESRGVGPLLKLLNQMGGWPVIEKKWDAKSFQWTSAVSKIQLQTSYGFILLLMVGPDAKNTTSNILQLDRPSISTRREILLNHSSNYSKRELEGYKKFFTSIAKLFLVEDNNTRLEEDFKKIIEFETNLVKMMRPDEELRNISVWYNKMNINTLQKKVPGVDWLSFLRDITDSSLSALGKNTVLKETDFIIVRDLDYIQKMAKFMKSFTDKRQVANYLGWRMIMTHILHLPEEFGKALQNYSLDTGLQPLNTERWKVCTNLVKSKFEPVASFLFIYSYFRTATMRQVDMLALEMKNAFDDMFDDNSWMDHSTKSSAKLKLKAMKQNIGYPKWLSEADEIDRYYNEINIPEMTDNIFENDLNLAYRTTQLAISTLIRLRQTEEWPISSVTVNAAYNPNKNSITVPAAFLQFPLYDPTLPRYCNYAAVGSIIGHEMTHGFDNEGRKRNATGAIHNWWSAEALEKFTEKAQCLVNQYNGYKVNGRLTQAENIADNVGLRQSYKVFREWRNETELILTLPEFQKYSIEQLFFITYGSIWCTKYQPEYSAKVLIHDVHSPARFRVQGTVSNMEEFSVAFNCKPGSSHNPENRCIIWN